MHRGYHGMAIPTVERTTRVAANWVLSTVFGRDTSPIRNERTPRRPFEEATGIAPKEEKARI